MATRLYNRKDKLFLGLKSGKNYGWGVCSEYLISEISKQVDVHVLSESDGTAENNNLNGKLFQTLTDVDFFPLFEKARGTSNFGYTFFENELTDNSKKNSKRYDIVFAGSSWCRDRMIEAGITNGDVLLQGVDPQRFYPIQTPKSKEAFVIFSGGKFEFRKGQDLVLKAVKILMDKHRDILLVNCWYNMWPESMRMMNTSSHITFNYSSNVSWKENMKQLYIDNGLDPKRIITLDIAPNDQLRALYAQTDIGVFPNRCEGGTNLVMMEYMACAKPVIASSTSGHLDIINAHNAFLLKNMRPLNIVNSGKQLIARWEEPSLEELVATIEMAYHQRDVAGRKGRQAGIDLAKFTWERTATTLLEKIT
jgi:glycosyltransferase involved in cell wall biosynthesis